MKKILLIVCHCFFLVLLSHGQKDTLEQSISTPDLYLDVIDSVLLESTRSYFCTSSDSCFLNVHDLEWDSVPSVPDSVFQARLAILDAQTPMDLRFRPELASYLKHYTIKRRNQVGRMLSLSNYYFPLFEQKLDEYNIPLELKYLAIVESALNPTAQSRAGAIGLWQFMYHTGKSYNLYT
ncbi:MAG: lytic transglycosylase domain-containing protein, partial [Flavobacteriales bacterium]|nr:lytic transglycosylase domain-containing protein [Flavobacteriales bacterium]